MADTKVSALGSVTPVLTDYVYVVDDPGGTPASGRSTFQQVMDLFEANFAPPGSSGVNAQTGTTYTLVLSDANKTVTMSNASANTLTIPTNASVAFPTGTVIVVFMLGAGTTTIAGDTGVTLSGNGGSGSAYSADIQTQYGAATLIKIDTNSWLISGDIDTVAA